MLTMDVQAILRELRDQRDRIQRAIDALEHTTPGSTRQPQHRERVRHMSAEGRARIAAAARRRWAAARKAGKRTLRG